VEQRFSPAVGDHYEKDFSPEVKLLHYNPTCEASFAEAKCLIQPAFT